MSKVSAAVVDDRDLSEPSTLFYDMEDPRSQCQDIKAIVLELDQDFLSLSFSERCNHEGRNTQRLLDGLDHELELTALKIEDFVT